MPRFARRLINNFGGGSGLLGAVIILTLLVVAIGAPWIAPYDPLRVDIVNQMQEPGPEFWLGTDQSGRDVLSRIIWGTRASISVAAIAVMIGMAGGVSLGLMAGFYRGGWLEQITMRFLEAIAAIPILIWAIALVGIFGVGDAHWGPFTVGSELKLSVLLGVLYIPTLARVTYTTAAVESQAYYVLARRLQGTSSLRIIVSDVLPNCLSPVIVQSTLLLAIGIVIEASVSFVGLGVQPPTPSWGNIISEGRDHSVQAWWIMLFPGLGISLAALGMNLLGDGLRDVLDPRLKVET